MAAADPEQNINVIGPSWHGYAGLRHLVIFGDSYSGTGYEYNKESTIPSDESPLGLEFPGITWAEPAMPNWVGYLITEHSPYTRLLVYNYAMGDDTVNGVRKQVQVNFLPRVGEKPSWARWSSDDTLFITWIGINDCASIDQDGAPLAVEELFVEQESLYKAGARNFLFIDIPPIHRTPVGAAFSNTDTEFHRIYEVWNTSLREHVVRFSADHPDITTLFFSSWNTFSRVLDDPMTHGFAPEHVSRSGGDIWADNLHPSHKMHDWIAHDLSKFLNAHPPYQAPEKYTEGGEPKS